MAPDNDTKSNRPQAAEVAEQRKRRSDLAQSQRVVIRPYSKIIVYYPTMIAALVCGGITAFFADNVSVIELTAATFVALFFVNTVIMAFEFPRMTAVAVMLLVVAVFLVVVLLNRYLNVIHFLGVLLGRVHLHVNTQFYFFVAGSFLLVFGVAWIVTRFDYWEVLNNELLHHHGPFGDLERFPAPQLKLDKEIPDIFEYFFLRSGRLIFYPTSERRAIIVDTVLKVDEIETRVKRLLGALDVRMNTDEPAE